MIHLTRIDPARNMARFYTMALQPTLFGEWALLREWGLNRQAGRSRPRSAEDTGMWHATNSFPAKPVLPSTSHRASMSDACGAKIAARGISPDVEPVSSPRVWFHIANTELT